jgi:leader peptidase (prepilin peptidase)/N-methyltransferase
VIDIVLAFLGAFSLSLSANICAYFLVKKEVPTYRLFHHKALLLHLIFTGLIFLFFNSIEAFEGSWYTYLLLLWAIATAAQTDAQTLLISRWTSLFLVPIAWAFANLGWLQISPLESIIGSLVGLLTLGVTAYIARKLTRQESIGQGDVDLLAFIGAFLGPLGCFRVLLFGSILGSLFGIGCLFIHGTSARKMHLPLGTFLSIATLIELLTQINHSFFYFLR